MKAFEKAITEFEALCDDPRQLDVLFSSWRTIAGLRGRFANALGRVLRRKGKVTLIVGGIVDDVALNQLLLEVRALLKRSDFRSAAMDGGLRISHDAARKKCFHARIWLGLKRGKIVEARCGSFDLSDVSLRANFEIASSVQIDASTSDLFGEVIDIVSDHRLDFHKFFVVEDQLCVASVCAMREEFRTDARFSYLSQFKRKHAPRINKIISPPLQ